MTRDDLYCFTTKLTSQSSSTNSLADISDVQRGANGPKLTDSALDSSLLFPCEIIV